MTSERAASMQPEWIRLLGGYGVRPDAASQPFEILVAAYSAPHRHYHTLDHLAEMFRIAARLGSMTDDTAAVEIAIWFHDAVYEPFAQDNEARSASLATELLKPLGVPLEVLERVAQLVNATAHVAAGPIAEDRETAILLDADLAILGAEEPQYRKYSVDIRKEYSAVPEVMYRAGRIKILEGFLERPRIYRTELMHRERDDQARANLFGELQELRS